VQVVDERVDGVCHEWSPGRRGLRRCGPRRPGPRDEPGNEQFPARLAR
jgi:hypothetical protein